MRRFAKALQILFWLPSILLFMGSKIDIHPYFHKVQEESEEPGFMSQVSYICALKWHKHSKTLLLHQENKDNPIDCIFLIRLLKEAMNVKVLDQ